MQADTTLGRYDLHTLINRVAERARSLATEETERINRPNVTRLEAAKAASDAAETSVRRAFAELVELGRDDKFGIVVAERGSPAFDGEMVFVVRGRDEVAPTVVRCYSKITEQSERGRAEVADATREVAHRLVEWQGRNFDRVHAAD